MVFFTTFILQSCRSQSVLFDSASATAAYDNCCTAKTIDCNAADKQWFQRIVAKRDIIRQGDATLFWAHMRKSGGSSLSYHIESATFNHTAEAGALFKFGFTRTVKVHLAAMSKHCVTDKKHKETLYVTTLRQPLNRYVSEYNYRKLGRHMPRNASLKELVANWMYQKNDKPINMQMAPDKLIDNWQTRFFTNSCPCDDLVTPPIHDSHPNYSYWRSGCKLDNRQLINTRDLHQAMHVIDKFDVVAIAPYFQEGKCDMMPWFRLAGSAIAKSINIAVNVNKRTKPRMTTLDGHTYIPDSNFNIDNDLFAFAKDLSERRKRISCCVVKTLQLD